MDKLTISSTLKKYPKKYPYAEIKQKIMGVRYELSLNFIGKTRAATLNKKYRNKTYTPNVLSFPLSEKVGEIFICPQIAKSEAAKYSTSVEGHVAYLFIHGLLHLKGLCHGEEMEKAERKYLKQFNIT